MVAYKCTNGAGDYRNDRLLRELHRRKIRPRIARIARQLYAGKQSRDKCSRTAPCINGERFARIQPANTLVAARLVGEPYLVEIEADAEVDDPR